MVASSHATGKKRAHAVIYCTVAVVIQSVTGFCMGRVIGYAYQAAVIADGVTRCTDTRLACVTYCSGSFIDRAVAVVIDSVITDFCARSARGTGLRYAGNT